MNHETMTLTPHVGDRLRDAYWSNPTAAQIFALCVVGATLAVAALAVM